jgi:ketosteroid isomerase-like protein
VSSEEDKNKALVRRFLEAHARGDLGAMEEMLAPDFVLPHPLRHREAACRRGGGCDYLRRKRHP